MSGVKYGTGRGKFIGQSIIHPNPITLDATEHFGATLVREDGQFLYSNGLQWIVPKENNDISRPSALVPTNSNQQTQLRLTAYNSPFGIEQTGAAFEISTNGVDFNSSTFKTVLGNGIDKYQILYPEDGFVSGNTILWRAAYTGQGEAQSDFSLPFLQTYPQLIDNPTTVTREGAVTGAVQISDFNSPLGLLYVETQVEFWNITDDPAVDAPFEVLTSTQGSSTPIPESLTEGAAYYWRARYGGRVGLSGPITYTVWTPVRSFFNGARSMVLVYDPSLAAGRTIFLPLGGTVNVSIDWGDGQTETRTSVGASHTYAAGVTGLVTVIISGVLSEFGQASNVPGNNAMIRVDNFGFGLGLVSLAGALNGTSASLIYVNPSLPPQVTNLSNMFRSSSSGVDLSNLDVSSVTNMTSMFFNASGPCGNGIGSWDVSAVTDMRLMFLLHNEFNEDISGWNTANVLSMEQMFYTANAFNQPIGGWDVSKVTNMYRMLRDCFEFNQPLGNWDVSSVTNMREMFTSSFRFNQDLGAWDVSRVTDMYQMFANGGNNGVMQFNNGNTPNLRNWGVSSVVTMRQMFAPISSTGVTFNQSVDNWDVSSCQDFYGMFDRTPYNQSMNNWTLPTANGNLECLFFGASQFDNGGSNGIENWDVSGIVNMKSLFEGARDFNRTLAGWDVSGVTNMENMFRDALKFNQPIGGWNVSSVMTMRGMLSCPGANQMKEFNQPINSWNVSNVTDMAYMFSAGPSSSGSVRNVLFNQPLNLWDVSNVTSMEGMFQASTSGLHRIEFDQDISMWQLNASGVNLTNMFSSAAPDGLSQENYSKILAGWANNVSANNGPFFTTLGATGRRYNAVDYLNGELYEDAVEGRAYLTNSNRLGVSGASDTDANGTYVYDGTVQLYVNANDWFFIKTAGAWELRDSLEVVQATQQDAGNLAEPQLVTTWDGDLASATVLRTGAAWNITDGGLAA
jgi:surface protein